jgi:phage terminase Nu1 subunit (DNA packaging protein)
LRKQEDLFGMSRGAQRLLHGFLHQEYDGQGDSQKHIDRKGLPLKGWTAIAQHLGLTPATAQRWAREGMPVRREGRFTVADPAELESWLGRESHTEEPAHVITGDADIAAALKESISIARRKKA